MIKLLLRCNYRLHEMQCNEIDLVRPDGIRTGAMSLQQSRTERFKVDGSGNSKLVAIVVVLSNRSYLTPSEEISLKHLRHYLAKYDKYLVIPKDLKFELSDFNIKRVDEKYFGSLEAHTKFLFSSEIYEAYSNYKYILMYHLDALVFSDDLEKWCEMDFDYIGSPWLKHKDAPYAGNPDYEGKVGNGGFSLRKVSSFLKIFNSSQYAISPNEYWKKYYANKSISRRILGLPKNMLMKSRRYNNVRWELDRWTKSEENFIANRAAHYYPEFKIAPWNVAVYFSFECVPRYAYELTGRTLPFGCHAWEKYDRAFWEQHLLG